MEHYGLSEEDCNQKISDLSLEDIARSSCRKWRDLPSRLVLPSILVEDIDRSGTGEGEKRLNFFREWNSKQMCHIQEAYWSSLGYTLQRRCRVCVQAVEGFALHSHTLLQHLFLFQKCHHSCKLGLLLLQQVTLSACMYPRPHIE